jgi:osmotically-inducible protein OsmY
MTKRLRYTALGAALAYFLDPDNGRSRRKATGDRLAALARRRSSSLAGNATSEAHALKQQPDDVTLARKVETEIFRDADVPKGKINVNAENGKVVLRGEADSPEMIDDLVGKARSVQGVQDVESLLQVSGE